MCGQGAGKRATIFKKGSENDLMKSDIWAKP